MLASNTALEEAGNPDYQNEHMGKIMAEGFSFSGFERDKLYLNDKGEGYIDISGVSGLDAVSDGRGAAYGDFDNDGDYDVFLTSLQGQVHHLFKNNVGQDQGYIRIDLVGTASGSDAFGAVVRLQTSQGILTKIKAGGSGFVSQSDPRLLFGLGRDPRAQWLEVVWPSGTRQRFESIAALSSLRLVEGNPTLEYLEEPRLSLPHPLDQEKAFLQALNYGPGQPFPSVKLWDPHGQETNFHTYRQPNRAYLINLWATYCAPCRQEMPQLQKLAAGLKTADVEVIGISLDMGAQRRKVPRVLDQLKITYPTFTTDKAIFTQLFSGDQVLIPLSFIIDRQGQIIEVLTGWNKDSAAQVRRALAIEH